MSRLNNLTWYEFTDVEGPLENVKKNWPSLISMYQRGNHAKDDPRQFWLAYNGDVQFVIRYISHKICFERHEHPACWICLAHHLCATRSSHILTQIFVVFVCVKHDCGPGYSNGYNHIVTRNNSFPQFKTRNNRKLWKDLNNLDVTI